MEKRFFRAVVTAMGVFLSGPLMSACSESDLPYEEMEIVESEAQPLIYTSWEDVSTGAQSEISNASPTIMFDGWVDVFYAATEGTSHKIMDRYYNGTSWSSPIEMTAGQTPTMGAATSCANGSAETLWKVSNNLRISAIRFDDPGTWTSRSDVPDVATPIRGYSAVSWTGDCWWYSMFYLTGTDGILKHKWLDKNSGIWSGEEILTDPNNNSISGVDYNFKPTAIFDGTAIRIFYVRAADHKIKVRDYPYNGDWGKVSPERCTGQTLDAGGSFGVAWDSTHKVNRPDVTTTGTAYLVFRRSGSTDIGVNFSATYQQGSWYADSSYTLQTGHDCVSGYTAISFRGGKVEVFCNTSTGTIRHGVFNSFG